MMKHINMDEETMLTRNNMNKTFPLLTKIFFVLAVALLSTTMTNALTWDGSTNEGCVNFEPLGSCPETSYTNTVRESSTTYFLDYNGSDENITYSLKIPTANNTCWTPHSQDTCANATISSITGSADLAAISKQTILFEFLNGTRWVQMYNWQSNASNNITSNYIQGKNIIFNYLYYHRDPNNGYVNSFDGILVTFNYSIKGKSLTLVMTANESGVYQYTTDSFWLRGSQPTRVFDMSNHSFGSGGVESFYILNNSIFYNIDVIVDKSDFTIMNSNYADDFNINISTIDANIGTTYDNKTDNEKNVFNETIYFTLSSNAEDMTIYNKNPRSSYYDELKNKWFLRIPGNCGYSGCIWNHTKEYQAFGFDMSRGVAFLGGVGKTEESFWNYSYSETKTSVQSTMTNLTNLNMYVASYIILQDIYAESPFYNSTTYNGVTLNASNYSYIMMNSDDTILSGWGTSYASKHEMRLPVLKVWWNNITNDWLNNYIFLDAEAATTLTYVDRDSNSSVNGTLRKQIETKDEYINYVHDRNMFIMTENFDPLWTAGKFDVGDAYKDRDGVYNLSLGGVIVDNYISHISNKMIIYQPYLNRYMLGWDANTTKKYSELATDEFLYQRYITEAGVYRQRPLIDMNFKEGHNISFNLTIQLYYVLDYLTMLEYESSIVNMSYINESGMFMSLSQAILDDHDFYNPLIFEEWSNGLRIYANLNNTGWWNLTINGATRNIPPNGLYAYMTDGSFEMFFNDGNLSTWVRNADGLGSIFLYPKDDATITFDLTAMHSSDGTYTAYQFYGDDSENGLRLVDPELSGTRTTNNVEILRDHTQNSMEANCANPISSVLQNLMLIALIPLIVIIALMYKSYSSGGMIGGAAFGVLTGICVLIIGLILILVMISGACMA